MVSFINTPASVVSRVVLNMLTDLTSFAPKYGLKNSLDLVARLQSHNLKPGNIMVSFDVSNLFTSIPMDESVLLVRNLLETKVKSHCTMSLVRICLKQFFFQFNGGFYEQEDGYGKLLVAFSG